MISDPITPLAASSPARGADPLCPEIPWSSQLLSENRMDGDNDHNDHGAQIAQRQTCARPFHFRLIRTRRTDY
jgi:hypothetical protein